VLLARVPPANVVFLDDLDSTVAFAERLMKAWLAADEDPLAQTLLVAARQHAGRGRGEHSWESPEGGLYANWLAWLPGRALPVLPLAVGVTLATAIEAFWPPAMVGLKWPNDLVAGGRKLGGILCQSRGPGDPMWVSVGFGVNLTTAPALPPGSTSLPTCLRDLGWRGSVGEGVCALAQAFLEGVQGAVADPDATRHRWVQRSVHRRGDILRVQLADTVVEGTFAGFDADALLLLEVGDELRRFSAGEVLAGCGTGGS